ncbi:hypothetical protein Acr_29g0011960 [Actinidia rufa]|uniref:Haloacid dehalogenase-like hydrolase (HAD) superfamily protein n=1 Tax=Actinidia rufa TaxID=165716 RepID=A0A7J0HGL0_9ERIC|nr:hypothetical protein Acr_29g0011960 [Actinidia rufa]
MDSCNKSTRDSSPFDCLLFDLDETLYSAKIGIGEATKRNIDDFLVQECGFPVTQTKILRIELFKTYGSSLAGFACYDIDADDYHRFFTNSDRIHATKALDRLGIRDSFEQIICFETMNPNLAKSTRPDEFPVVLKPSLEAFRIAIDVAEIDPRRTLFLDDSVRNVAAGKAVGLRTALVGRSIKIKEADFVLETVNSLAQAIPEIWLGEGQRMTRTRSQMDPMLATAPIGA